MAFKARSSRRTAVNSNTTAAQSAAALTATQRPTRRDLLETLENRQLMAVTSAAFNFQPASSATPSGFYADSGQTFRSQNGLQYGWTLNNTGDTRDRNTAADGRLDTLIQFNNSKWELAVPNGTYDVALTAGDASYIDSKFVITAEGKTILNASPTSSKHFLDASGSVVVTDGKLTIGGGSGARNNKLVSLSVKAVSGSIDTAGGASVAKPAAPTWTSSYSDTTNSAYVKWNDVSRNESGFIIERSLDNKGWTEAGRVGANVTTFTATNLNAGTKYYFRVKSFNAGGTSAASPIENATTLKSSVTKPAVVAGVTLTATSATSVTVKWNDLSNESGYRVARSTDKATFTDLATVGANTTTYSDTTAKASTKYYYRITGFNAAGTSATGAYAVTTPATATKAPVSPTWLGAKSNGAGAILTWGDVAGETGYIIERSSSTGAYVQVAKVGANVVTYNVTGLAANTNYTFRVKAYNNSGTSAASVLQTIKTGTSTTTNPSTPSTPSTPSVPSTPTPSIPSASRLAGINANGGDAASNRSALNDVGVKYVRIAMKSGWSLSASKGWYADQARSYKAAGFRVMLCVMPTGPTSYSNAKQFYSNLAADSSLRNAVDYWQIGNEPNIGKFWSGSASSYVSTSLKPAYEALHAAGEPVVGGGPSWDVGYVKQLVSLGYNNYVDFAAFHPYGNGAAECISRAQAAKAAFGGKPVMFTEWSVSGSEGNSAKWASENTKVASALAGLGSLSFYYGLRQDSSRVGAGSILTGGGSKNGAFYSSMKDWLN